MKDRKRDTEILKCEVSFVSAGLKDYLDFSRGGWGHSAEREWNATKHRETVLTHKHTPTSTYLAKTSTNIYPKAGL